MTETEEIEEEIETGEENYSGQMAVVGLHLDEVVRAWDEQDKREAAILWGKLFRESVIQDPIELIRRAADVEGLTKAIENLERQRDEIIAEIMAVVDFLSLKIQSRIDITAADLSEIIDTERLLLKMTLSRKEGVSGN